METESKAAVDERLFDAWDFIHDAIYEQCEVAVDKVFGKYEGKIRDAMTTMLWENMNDGWGGFTRNYNRFLKIHNVRLTKNVDDDDNDSKMHKK